MKVAAFIRIVFVLLSARPIYAGAALAPPASAITLAGDGLVLVVLEESDQGVVRGELQFGDAIYPFTGSVEEVAGVDVGRGTFSVDGHPFSFTTRERDDGGIDFTTDGKTYRLRPANGERDVPPEKPANPLAQGEAPAKALAREPARAAAMPASLKLRRTTFPDVDMGGVVAYTMLIPEGWRAEGQIQWMEIGGVTPFPQKRVDVVAPDGSRIRIVPTLSYAYSERTPAAIAQDRQNPALAVKFDQGVAPPDDVGAYGLWLVKSQNPQGKDFRLVEARHDADGDALLDELDRLNPNPNGAGGKRRTHYIDVAYEEDGVRWHERIHLTLSQTPMQRTQWVNFLSWSAFVYSELRAPEADFDTARPMLLAVALTFQPTVQWFAQSQMAISQMISKRHDENMAAIRRRAQLYDQLSDQQMQSFRERMAAGDRIQDSRLNALNEVTNFQAPEGGTVKLPIHYKNYYGDGKGNFVMTNSTLDAPGGDFKELERAK